VEPIPLGQAHVENQQIELFRETQVLRALAVVGDKSGEAVGAKPLLEEGADERVVFSDQDSSHLLPRPSLGGGRW
jgi:hypothetical protein